VVNNMTICNYGIWEEIYDMFFKYIMWEIKIQPQLLRFVDKGDPLAYSFLKDWKKKGLMMYHSF